MARGCDLVAHTNFTHTAAVTAPASSCARSIRTYLAHTRRPSPRRHHRLVHSIRALPSPRRHHHRLARETRFPAPERVHVGRGATLVLDGDVTIDQLDLAPGAALVITARRGARVRVKARRGGGWRSVVPRMMRSPRTSRDGASRPAVATEVCGRDRTPTLARRDAHKLARGARYDRARPRRIAIRTRPPRDPSLARRIRIVDDAFGGALVPTGSGSEPHPRRSDHVQEPGGRSAARPPSLPLSLPPSLPPAVVFFSTRRSPSTTPAGASSRPRPRAAARAAARTRRCASAATRSSGARRSDTRCAVAPPGRERGAPFPGEGVDGYGDRMGKIRSSVISARGFGGREEEGARAGMRESRLVMFLLLFRLAPNMFCLPLLGLMCEGVCVWRDGNARGREKQEDRKRERAVLSRFSVASTAGRRDGSSHF